MYFRQSILFGISQNEGRQDCGKQKGRSDWIRLVGSVCVNRKSAMTDALICAICSDTIEENGHSLEGCGHTFHTGCIVMWFRQASSCPMCRDAGTDNLIDGIALRERSALLMRTSRNKGAPIALKTLAGRVRKQQTAVVNVKRRLLEHKRRHREVLTTHNRLFASSRLARVRLSNLRRLMGLYHDATLRLPPLLVSNRGRVFNGFYQ